MATGMELVKRKASKRGYTALATVGATTAFFAFGWTVFGVLSLVSSFFLIYRWFSYRAKWGLRF